MHSKRYRSDSAKLPSRDVKKAIKIVSNRPISKVTNRTGEQQSNQGFIFDCINKQETNRTQNPFPQKRNLPRPDKTGTSRRDASARRDAAAEGKKRFLDAKSRESGLRRHSARRKTEDIDHMIHACCSAAPPTKPTRQHQPFQAIQFPERRITEQQQQKMDLWSIQARNRGQEIR